MAVPTPNEPLHQEIDESCPDCGKRPITGQFVYLARTDRPVELRAQLMEEGVADIRMFGDVLASFVDWNCSDEECRGMKTYDVPPVTRLAKRAAP